MPFPHEIFKAYDIRGVVDKTLTTEIVEQVGKAFGSEAIEQVGLLPVHGKYYPFIMDAFVFG